MGLERFSQSKKRWFFLTAVIIEDKKGISMRSEDRGAWRPVLRLWLGVGVRDKSSAVVEHQDGPRLVVFFRVVAY